MASKRARNPGDPTKSGPGSEPPRKHSGVVVRPPLVLVLDADADRRVSLVTYLSHAGFRVLEADREDEAIELACAAQPTLALLDLGTTNLAFCRRLKDHEDVDEIEVVLLGDAADGREVAATEAGCTAFLPRPCAPAAVVRVIVGTLVHAGRARTSDG